MKVPSVFSPRGRTTGSPGGAGSWSGSPDAAGYKPLFEIGRGGMGVVTLALARGPEQFAKLVVLKRLHEHLLTDPESVQMLLDEARVLARLAHPNVVRVYEATLNRGAPTIVLEYLEGLPLPELIGPPTPLPLRLHLSVLIQALRGLGAAHELVDFDGTALHLVHRDMSPQNVFVGYDGVVKVLDFGIAKVVGSDEGVTRTGVVKGKLRYMAPEQVAGGEIDRRSDLFSVGVMLWEAIAGRRLWADLPDGQVIRGLLEGKIPRLPTQGVDARLERVCERALAVGISERYSTAIEFRQELQACVEATSGELVDDGLIAFLLQHFGARRDEMRARIAERIQRATSRPPGSSLGPTRRLGRAAARVVRGPGRLAAILTLMAGALLTLAVTVVTPSIQRRSAAGAPSVGADSAASASEELRCEPGSKPCDGRCVSSARPEHGCGLSSCTPCSSANATPRCGRDGSCGIAVCYRGYDDCDGVADNGCEVFLRTDAAHCGACSAPCPALPHAQVGCGDTCRIWRCDPGYEDCNGVTEDGCEVDVRGDRQHCGACAEPCSGTRRCRGGECVP